ncbi:LysR family transcriptional regulator [Novosphingobium sp.]|uniref:winged helix-turn-helix domain-containing protein n=1 Tax=Novosphingobium sp. TaxID=1874826 RepID=UPI00333FF622
MKQTIKLKLQVLCDDAIAMGPGKADLLERIASTGSIAGAARQMGMSYRRAWQLVDVMNRCWQSRLVETTPGRAAGGAHLTEFGLNVLIRYRDLQQSLDTCAEENGWHTLASLIRERPIPHEPSAHLSHGEG